MEHKWPLNEAKQRIIELEAELARVREERDALQRFKDYVHKRLDDAGIPVDPESPHKAAGCRIGGRLDIALGRTERVARQAYKAGVQWQFDQLVPGGLAMVNVDAENEAVAKAMREGGE